MPRSSPKSKRPVAAKGRYANYFAVGHTAFEFVLDFGEAYAGQADSPCHTRIVTSPAYVVSLLDLLKKSAKQYEDRFGPMGEGK